MSWLGYESVTTRSTLKGTHDLLVRTEPDDSVKPAASRARAAARGSYGYLCAADGVNAQSPVGIGVGSASALPPSTSLMTDDRSMACVSARRTLTSPKNGLPA